MTRLFKKSGQSAAPAMQGARHCRDCGLEVTDAGWHACPRCGKALPHGCGCGGCGRCGH